MDEKQLAELVHRLKKARDASQAEVARAIHRDDRLMVEYHRGRLDACRDAIRIIEESINLKDLPQGTVDLKYATAKGKVMTTKTARGHPAPSKEFVVFDNGSGHMEIWPVGDAWGEESKPRSKRMSFQEAKKLSDGLNDGSINLKDLPQGTVDLKYATAKGKVMTTKTASGYNHPAIKGRFFQKKADLERALKTSLAAPAGRGRAEPQRKGRGAKPQSEDDLWEQLDNHSWKEVRDDEQADQLSRSKLSPDERKALEEREALEAREYHEAYQKSFEWSQQDVETLRQAINALKSLSQKISNDDYPFNENSFHIMIGNLGGLLSTKAAAETSGSPRNPTAKGKVMTTKTASGYNHPALPGRFFQEKAELQQTLKKVAFTGAWSGLDWRALSTEEMVALSKFPFLQKMFEDDKEYVEFMETVGRAANPAERVRKEIPDEELEAEELLREHHSFGKPQGRKSTEPRYGPEHFPPYTADGQSPRPHGADFDDAYVAE